MEPLRMVDERFPILWWCARLPGKRGTVDRDGANDPDHDPDKHGEHSCTPEPKAGGGTIENRYGNPRHRRRQKEGGYQHTQPQYQCLTELDPGLFVQHLARYNRNLV